MKLIMVFGGLIGFAIGFGFSAAQGSAWPTVVWRAAARALPAGMHLRWWGRFRMKCLRDALHERQSPAAAVAAKTAETPSTPATK